MAYQDAPQNTWVILFATVNKFLRVFHLERCCKETRDTVALALLKKRFIHVAKATTAPCAAISRVTWKRGFEIKMHPF